MRKVKTTAIVLSSLLACYSCKKETSIEEISTTEDIYDTPIPLKIGNYWEYETSSVSYSHQEEKMLTKSYGRHRITVTGDTIINDEKFFLIDGSFASIQPPREEEIPFLLINCKDGIVSSEKTDFTYYSSNFNHVNNSEDRITNNEIKTRQELSNLDTTFLINDTEIINPVINNAYLTLLDEDIEIIKPVQEIIIDEKIGILSVTSRHTSIANQTDGPNKNDRFEKKLVSYNIQ